MLNTLFLSKITEANYQCFRPKAKCSSSRRLAEFVSLKYSLLPEIQTGKLPIFSQFSWDVFCKYYQVEDYLHIWVYYSIHINNVHWGTRDGKALWFPFKIQSYHPCIRKTSCIFSTWMQDQKTECIVKLPTKKCNVKSSLLSLPFFCVNCRSLKCRKQRSASQIWTSEMRKGRCRI